MTRKKVHPRWRQSIEVRMEDGSIVTVSADLTDSDVELTARDMAAIRACINEISLRRLDPQRAQRRAKQAAREEPVDALYHYPLVTK